MMMLLYSMQASQSVSLCALVIKHKTYDCEKHIKRI